MYGLIYDSQSTMWYNFRGLASKIFQKRAAEPSSTPRKEELGQGNRTARSDYLAKVEAPQAWGDAKPAKPVASET